MSMMSLLYISTSRVAADSAEGAVNKIVDTAHARNPEMGLTGALLFTGEHFAQVLEGTKDSIDLMMAGILQDSRHADVLIVNQGLIAQRRFPDWNMAYSGPSQFVSQHISRLLGEPRPVEQRKASQWLNDLMWEFSAGAGAN